MKKIFTLILLTVFFAANIITPIGVSAALTQAGYADFKGYANNTPSEAPTYNNAPPSNETNKGMTFGNYNAKVNEVSVLVSPFSAVSGMFGKAADDVSVMFGNEEGNVGDASNVYINYASNPQTTGNIFEIRAKIASFDKLSAKHIELGLFGGGATSHLAPDAYGITGYEGNTRYSGHPFQVTSAGTILCYGGDTGLRITDPTSRWIDVRIIVTCGFKHPAVNPTTHNKLELYVDGVLAATKYFNAAITSATELQKTVTGCRQARVAHTVVKAAGNIAGTTKTYADDYALSYWPVTDNLDPYVPPQLTVNNATGIADIRDGNVYIADNTVVWSQLQPLLNVPDGVTLELWDKSAGSTAWVKVENNGAAVDGKVLKVIDTNGNWYYRDILVEPYVSPELVITEPTDELEPKGIVSIRNGKLVVADSEMLWGDLRGRLSLTKEGTIELADSGGNVISDDNAPVYEQRIKITGTENDVFYYDIISQLNIVNQNFNSGSTGISITKKTAAQSSELDALGGRAAGDKSLVLEITNYDGRNGTKAWTDANIVGDPDQFKSSDGPDSYMEGRSTESTGILSFELSIYKNADEGRVLVSVPYFRTGDTTAENGWFNAIILDYPEIDSSTGNVIRRINDANGAEVGTYENNRWYKMSCTVNTIDKTATVYLNGDRLGGDIVNGVHTGVYKLSTMQTGRGIQRMKGELRFPNLADAATWRTARDAGTLPSYSGTAAFDDFKFFYGAYDNTYNYIGIDTQDPNIFIETALERIDVDLSSMGVENITASDFLDKFNFDCESQRIYTDDTLADLVGGAENIANNMILVLESENGETFKYYRINTAPVGLTGTIGENSEIELNNISSRVTINYGTTVGELKAGLTMYPNNTLKIIAPTDFEMTDDNAPVLKGSTIVVSNSKEDTKTYTVIVNDLIVEGPTFWIDDAEESAETLTAGTVKAEFKVVSAEPVGRDAVIMIAVYEGGKLADISLDYGTTGERGTIDASVTVANAAGKVVRAFLCEKDTMIPVAVTSVGITAAP